MKIPSSVCGALAVLACGCPLLAQVAVSPAIPSIPIFLQQSFTTGMIGFAGNQTARLNVLNLNSASSSTTYTAAPRCTVELQLIDAKNNVVKQATVANLAPGTATSLDVARSAVTSETAARAEIRGAVVVNPTSASAGSTAPAGYCSVAMTLEIFDSASGSTIALTSDTHTLGLPIFTPVITQGRN